MSLIENLIVEIKKLPTYRIVGRVISVRGMLVQVEGLSGIVSVGSICKIYEDPEHSVLGEVVSVSGELTSLIPYDQTFGIAVGCNVEFYKKSLEIYPDKSWMGRVINAFGEPIDEKHLLMQGSKLYNLHASPPPANKRRKVGTKLDLGVKALNTFITCCIGQRLGIFAGSGVGKSVLIAMMTKYAKADVKVIGLIGERGREVREFLEDYLGEEGLKNAVVIVSTGDESPVMRRQAAYTTMAVAEYFRDQGLEVLCMLDSVTRYAMAQREIGLSTGEPPTTKGYPPSVFSDLPRLLERSGSGTEEQGNITGLFSVLIEGDDVNDPIADAVRGILDGHIVLDREIAERGRFPAVNVLKSISRTMPNCNTKEQNLIISKARSIMSIYSDMSELIRIGAYKKGSSVEVDYAIEKIPLIEQFLSQRPEESYDFNYCYQNLTEIVGNK